VPLPAPRVVYYDRLPQMPQGYRPHPCPKPVEELLVVVGALTKDCPPRLHKLGLSL
jgi:hypothetical protein